jgi:hypothetical protein
MTSASAWHDAIKRRILFTIFSPHSLTFFCEPAIKLEHAVNVSWKFLYYPFALKSMSGSLKQKK